MKLKAKIPHPIPYQGSKRVLADAILAKLPRKFTSLVEPFAGSAAISLAVAYHRRASAFVINDAHRPVADLWRSILERPRALADQYECLWREQAGREREYFDRVRARFNADHRPEDFLYLLARCVKASIRYNAEGHFNNTPDNRRKGARPAEMRERIYGAAALLAGKATVSALDYREVLTCHKCDEVIYMDPPYQGVSSRTTRDIRYAPKIDRREFHDALAALNRRSAFYLVSYDGRCGEKRYGEPLPGDLNLVHLELCAGRSTQATLLGRDHVTYESLYLSAALASAVGMRQNDHVPPCHVFRILNLPRQSHCPGRVPP